MLRATGLRDLDRLGGLRSRMPSPRGCSPRRRAGRRGAAAGQRFRQPSGCCCRPCARRRRRPPAALAVAMPLAVAVVALTAGLGRAHLRQGIGSRSSRPSPIRGGGRGRESRRRLRVRLGVAAAVACAASALLPGWVADRARRRRRLPAAASRRRRWRCAPSRHLPAQLYPAVSALDRLTAGAAGRRRDPARPRRRRRVAMPWGCGGVRVDPRMQYTATSFAEPLHAGLRRRAAPVAGRDVTPTEESRLPGRAGRRTRRVPTGSNTACTGRCCAPPTRSATWPGGCTTAACTATSAPGFVGAVSSSWWR